MNKPILTLTLVTAGLLALGAAGLAFSDADDDEHEGRHGWLSRADVAPVTDAAYRQECGACHMAYQPGLLPVRAWQQVLAPDALADHYGDDASLAEPVRAELAAYLTSHAADRSGRFRSRAFAVPPRAGDANRGEKLPRITETRYFRSEHHEIPARLVTANPEIGSFSQCNACHRRADDGVYDEDQVAIPGVGRWDD